MKRVLILFVLLALVCGGLVSIDLRKAFDGLRKVGEALRPINEEEEYYIGRAVAASILAAYPLLKNEELTRYLNLVGNALVIHSQRPEIFNGYHFAVLESDEINALSAPGGIVFLTRGLVQTAENEDELAAVLAHEICHIAARDPVKAIKAERTKALAAFGADELTRSSSKTVQVFQDTISDVSGTLLQKGYSRKQEKEADLAALKLLAESGYAPQALLSMLQKLEGREVKKLKVFSAHPPAADRCGYVAKEVAGLPEAAALAHRAERFQNVRKNSGV